MLKKMMILVISIICILGSCLSVYGESVQKDPVIIFNAGKGTVYLGDVYSFDIKVENLRNINSCTIILNYDPNVLRFTDQLLYPTEDAWKDYYCLVSNPKEGQVEIKVYYSENEYVTEEYDSDTFIGPCFDVIGLGNTEFSIEVVEEDCENSTNVQVDTTTLEKTVVEPDDDVKVNYQEGVITISGKGRMLSKIMDYDIDKQIFNNRNDVHTIIYEEGITMAIETGYYQEYENLKDIWYPDSIESFLFQSSLSENEITLHANGMTFVEQKASKYDYKFELSSSYIIGDIDLNDKLNAEDALRVLKMAAKIDPLYKWSADRDGNGVVDANDALEILKIAAGITVVE